MFEGFTSETADVGDTTIFLRRKGNGTPLLLLHGFPQTHVMWHATAPALSDAFTVICADLRGYGLSGKPASSPGHEPYSKRVMAADMVRMMHHLGYPRFAVAGHDRGGRVAYRMAFDHPDSVMALAVLDIVPTSEVFDRADARLAMTFWPWSLLAQPAPLPERLILAAPDAVIDDALSGWGVPNATATAWQSGARPVVVLTKADLCDEPDGVVAAAEAVAFGTPVLAVSAVTGDGMAELAAHLMPGETCVLVGSSGAGKSTLVNAFAGSERMVTAGIREDDARGRHTTTHRELVRLPGGALILDTPGMRELGLIDAEEGLGAAFDDIEALAQDCRFSDCGHGNEPGCAMRAALETGQLDPDRWRSFQKLQRELAHLDRKEDRVARDAEKRRWIARNKAYRAGLKIKQKDPWQ